MCPIFTKNSPSPLPAMKTIPAVRHHFPLHTPPGFLRSRPSPLYIAAAARLREGRATMMLPIGATSLMICYHASRRFLPDDVGAYRWSGTVVLPTTFDERRADSRYFRAISTISLFLTPFRAPSPMSRSPSPPFNFEIDMPPATPRAP